MDIASSNGHIHVPASFTSPKKKIEYVKLPKQLVSTSLPLFASPSACALPLAINESFDGDEGKTDGNA